MQHRDRITIQKIIDEIDIGIKLLGTSSQEEFLENRNKRMKQFKEDIK